MSKKIVVELDEELSERVRRQFERWGENDELKTPEEYATRGILDRVEMDEGESPQEWDERHRQADERKMREPYFWGIPDLSDREKLEE